MKFKALLLIVLSLFCFQYISAQKVKKVKKIEITGTVTGMDKSPIPNAIIMIDGEKTNSTTDAEGKYKVKVKPDAKKRVLIPKAAFKAGITYHIYTNRFGQIVLDPQVTIPASELWVFQNRDILASIDKGMKESESGQTEDRGSFAEHIKDEP